MTKVLSEISSSRTDELGLDLIVRLYDREVARKDMIERNAYFLATILGILISAGILQVKSIVDLSHTISARFPDGNYIVICAAVLFTLCLASFLFSLFQATRLRQWHAGLPSDIYEMIFGQKSTTDARALIETVCSHMLTAQGIAYSNNNKKAAWVHRGLFSLGMIVLLILLGVGILVFYGS